MVTTLLCIVSLLVGYFVGREINDSCNKDNRKRIKDLENDLLTTQNYLRSLFGN
jgi:hypothetical protein